MNELKIEAKVYVELRNHKTGEIRIIPGENIITDEGDRNYAQRICGETPTYTLTNLYLATEGPATPAKTDRSGNFRIASGSEKAPTTGYPRTNDPDTDNTGAGVDIVSWKFEYATADGPFTGITHSFISIAGVSHPTWQASTAYSLGDYVTPTTLNNFIYECTTAGTSGTTEPVWPTTDGATVTDGTVEWTCRAKQPILNSYKWATAWDKDTATSAKIFANHECKGT